MDQTSIETYIIIPLYMKKILNCCWLLCIYCMLGLVLVILKDWFLKNTKRFNFYSKLQQNDFNLDIASNLQRVDINLPIFKVSFLFCFCFVFCVRFCCVHHTRTICKHCTGLFHSILLVIYARNKMVNLSHDNWSSWVIQNMQFWVKQ